MTFPQRVCAEGSRASRSSRNVARSGWAKTEPKTEISSTAIFRSDGDNACPKAVRANKVFRNDRGLGKVLFQQLRPQLGPAQNGVAGKTLAIAHQLFLEFKFGSQVRNDPDVVIGLEVLKEGAFVGRVLEARDLQHHSFLNATAVGCNL